MYANNRIFKCLHIIAQEDACVKRKSFSQYGLRRLFLPQQSLSQAPKHVVFFSSILLILMDVVKWGVEGANLDKAAPLSIRCRTRYRCTRPDAPPPAGRSTSARLVRLASPLMEYLR